MKTKLVQHVPRINLSHLNFLKFQIFQIFKFFKFLKIFLVPSFCLTFRHFLFFILIFLFFIQNNLLPAQLDIIRPSLQRATKQKYSPLCHCQHVSMSIRARESVRAREHRSESGHPLRSQFWKISESVRDKMYVLESGSPLGSQLGDHRNF